jgi:hypothetical protein
LWVIFLWLSFPGAPRRLELSVSYHTVPTIFARFSLIFVPPSHTGTFNIQL